MSDNQSSDAGESCDSIESCFFLVMLVIFNSLIMILVILVNKLIHLIL